MGVCVCLCGEGVVGVGGVTKRGMGLRWVQFDKWEGGVVMEVRGAVECRRRTKGCLVWLLHATTHTTLS